jgi:hypothetical protein
MVIVTGVMLSERHATLMLHIKHTKSKPWQEQQTELHFWIMIIVTFQMPAELRGLGNNLVRGATNF